MNQQNPRPRSRREQSPLNDLTAITGGIGSGKSVVSRILQALGHPVYDCDSRAKALMDASSEIRSAIAESISPEAVVNGRIDRQALSAIVFSNPDALGRLNAIVHQAVRRDLEAWHASVRMPCFVETAILRESGLDLMCPQVWNVTAPEPLRVSRIMARSGLTELQAKQRMAAQTTDYPSASTIINDNVHPLLPQVLELLEKEKTGCLATARHKPLS